jgi:DNA-binding MarR family transcriptional regulator
MSGALQLPETVKRDSPSTRLVYAVLDDQGPLTLDEIVAETGVAHRTATRARAKLRDRERAATLKHPAHRRRRLYRTEADDRPQPHRN